MAKRGRKTVTKASIKPSNGDSWPVPAHLTGVSADAWSHVVGLLAERGNLDRTDPTIVEAYAINVSLLRAAQYELDRNGMTYTTTNGMVASCPAVAIVNTASMRLRAIINDLGLSPSSSKHAAGKSSAATGRDSKWDGLLGVVQAS
jgi:P27 family predicted phage terminase small subunit